MKVLSLTAAVILLTGAPTLALACLGPMSAEVMFLPGVPKTLGPDEIVIRLTVTETPPLFEGGGWTWLKARVDEVLVGLTPGPLIRVGGEALTSCTGVPGAGQSGLSAGRLLKDPTGADVFVPRWVGVSRIEPSDYVAPQP